MVAKLLRSSKSNSPGSSRSLRFGLLICAGLLLFNLGWEQPTQVNLGFIGDIMPDRGVKTVIRQTGLAGLFQHALAIFSDTDLVSANLEAAVTENSNPLIKTFRFNSPSNLGQYLYQSKIKAVTVANNHAIDYGKKGLQDTITHLTQDQVWAFGYGSNALDALAPKIITLKGVKIAFIGAVCFPLEGYVYLPEAFDVGRWDANLVGTQIQSARSQADILVISLHWGIEFTHYPTTAQVNIAHYCIDQGADLIIGHHPHVLQGMEVYHGKPIFYSLGNFIFDQRFGPTTESIFIKASIINRKLRRITLTPLSIVNCVPQPAKRKNAATIESHFLKYSQPFGTKTAKRWEFEDTGK